MKEDCLSKDSFNGRTLHLKQSLRTRQLRAISRNTVINHEVRLNESNSAIYVGITGQRLADQKQLVQHASA